MKLKKILASVAAIAMTVSAFANVAMAANSYGAPVITSNVEYPVDVDGTDYLIVTVGYKGFTGFSKYSALTKNGVGLTSAKVSLTYDTDALEYIATMDGEFADGTPGGSAPSMSYGWSDAAMKNVPETDNFMQCYFIVKDGVDFTKQQIEFNVNSVEFGVSKAVKGEATVIELYGNTNACTDVVSSTPITYGTAGSQTTTYAITATDDVTITGADDLAAVAEGTVLTVAAKAKDGYTAQLMKDGVAYNESTYTVTAAASFSVEYTPVFSATTTDKGLYKEDDVQAGIFYNLAIKNNAGDVDIAVDGQTFTTEGLVATTGDAVLDLTVVIVGYPNATVPACTVTEVAAQ